MGSSKLYELERFNVSMYSTKGINSLFNFKKFFFLTIFINQLVRLILQDFHLCRFFYKLKFFKSKTFFYRGIVIYRKIRFRTNFLVGNFWYFKHGAFLIISVFFFFYAKTHYKTRLLLKKINLGKAIFFSHKKNYKYNF